MKRITPLLALTLLLCCLTGCPNPDLSLIEPSVNNIANRHDAMLKGELDPRTLTDDQKQLFLDESQGMRDIFQQAKGGDE